jgi:NAD(P)H-flavin reductase
MVLRLPVLEALPATPRASIVRLSLEGQTFDYQAGQAVVAGLPGDSHRRPYSLADAPDWAAREGTLELLVSTDGPGNLGAMLARGERPSALDIEGPVGRFVLPPIVKPEERLLFVAGGTGIAPLRAMVRQAVLRSSCQCCVVYSARTPEEFAYRAEFEELAEKGRICLRQRVTRGTSDVLWEGPVGRLAPIDLVPFVLGSVTRCFVCGPPTLVDEVRLILFSLGVPDGLVHVEEWLQRRPLRQAVAVRTTEAAMGEPHRIVHPLGSRIA